MYFFVLGQDIVDGEGVHHPVLDGILIQCFRIGDVISVVIVYVTFYQDAEYVFYCSLVAVECGSGHRQAAGEFGALPFVIDFVQADSV